jgi:hypothetical protein
MKIVVACGFDPGDEKQRDAIRAFGHALGGAIAEHGHVLMNGCRTELDAIVAEGTHTRLMELGEPEPDKRIVCYVLANHEPSHNFGTIIRSRLASWEIAQETFYIPEQVQQADAVILVGGFQGTFQAANWARIAGKPLLPFTAFGGAAQKIYAQELNEFDSKYAGLVERLEYEELNSLNGSWSERATDLVALAEKSREVHREVAQVAHVLPMCAVAFALELQDIVEGDVVEVDRHDLKVEVDDLPA